MRNRYMHIRWNEEKQDIGAENVNISIPDSVGNKTKGNIMKLFAEYGFDLPDERKRKGEILF